MKVTITIEDLENGQISARIYPTDIFEHASPAAILAFEAFQRIHAFLKQHELTQTEEAFDD